eukprot:1146222-Pelagomonas_calceolata.AAC.1
MLAFKSLYLTHVGPNCIREVWKSVQALGQVSWDVLTYLHGCGQLPQRGVITRNRLSGGNACLPSSECQAPLNILVNMEHCMGIFEMNAYEPYAAAPFSLQLSCPSRQ